jgi:hypothetical protein
MLSLHHLKLPPELALRCVCDNSSIIVKHRRTAHARNRHRPTCVGSSSCPFWLAGIHRWLLQYC